MMGNPYVDLRMQEWRMDEQPSNLQVAVRKVLNELETEALLRLRDNRFEVTFELDPEFGYNVWAYFPIDSEHNISRRMRPKHGTTVLLVLNARQSANEIPGQLEACLRDHIGHVLLYLRDPDAWNDCTEAMKEWRRSIAKVTPDEGGRLTVRSNNI